MDTAAPAFFDQTDDFVHPNGEENEGWMSEFFNSMHVQIDAFSEVLKVQETQNENKTFIMRF